jgi:hypothetical protein
LNNPPKIFLSFAGGNTEDSADLKNAAAAEIEKKLTDSGYTVVHYKKDTKYMDNLQNFMRDNTNGYVVAIISSKYLKSTYCMAEVSYATFHGVMKDRFFPILLDDAFNITEDDYQKEIREYWKNSLAVLEEEVKNDSNQVSNDNRDTVQLIVTFLGKFFKRVAEEIISGPFEIQRKQNYAPLMDALNTKISLDKATDKLKHYSFDEIFSSFPDKEYANVLLSLYVLNEPVEEYFLKELCNIFKIKSCGKLIHYFSENSIFKKTSVYKFELKTKMKVYLKKKILKEDIEDFHFILGTTFLNIRKKHLKSIEMDLTCKYIKQFQLAGNYKKSQFYLLRNAKDFKNSASHDKYRELLKIQIVKDLDGDKWVEWHYAHCSYVLGDYKESHTMIAKLLKELISKYKSATYREKKFYNILLIKSFIHYAENLTQQEYNKEALNILLGIFEIINIPQINWDFRSQAFQVIGDVLIKLGKIDASREIYMKFLNESEITMVKYAKSIFNIKVGISFSREQKFSESLQYLKKGLEGFRAESNVDYRGVAWAFSYLSYVKFNLEDFSSAEEDLANCLKYSKEGSFADKEYYENLLFFKEKNKKNKKNVNDEIKRVREKFKETVLPKRETITTEYEEIKSKLNIEDDMEYKMPLILKELFKPLYHNPPGANDDVLRRMADNAKHAPQNCIDYILTQQSDWEKILSHPPYNNLIAECIKSKNGGLDIFKKYIHDKIAIILKQSESIRLHYAKAFEYIKMKNDAIELLKDFKDKDSDYYNVLGNCLQNRDPLKSLEYFSEALKNTSNPRKKRNLLNNMAQVIANNKLYDKYELAKQYCREAIAYKLKGPFPYPLEVIIKIEAEQNDLPKIENVVGEIIRRYGKLKEESIKGILLHFNNNPKKEILNKILRA